MSPPQRHATPGQILLLGVATAFAALFGCAAGFLLLFALEYGESGGFAVNPPMEVASLLGGALAGAIAGAPLAWWHRSWRPTLIGAAVFAAVALVFFALRT